MAVREGDNISNQRVLVLQDLVFLQGHCRSRMPAECIQSFLDKLAALFLTQQPPLLSPLNKLNQPFRKNFPLTQSPNHQLPRPLRQQLHPQQRRKYPKRIPIQRFSLPWPECSRVHREPGNAEIIVSHGKHAHNGEHAADG